MLGPGRHNLVEIGPKTQPAFAAAAGGFEFDGEEGRIFDGDAAALDRRDQPEAAVGFAAQDRGEKFDETGAGDGRTAIEPGAVARDPHVEIAVIDNLRFPGR